MWNYQPPTYNIAPQGNHRARIHNLIWDVSKSSGRDMLVITLKIQNKHSLKYYLVFNSDTPETINRSNFYFKQFCDAFNLNPDDMNKQGFSFNQWINAEGGVFIEHTTFNGTPQAHVKKLLTRKQLEYLPPYEIQQQNFNQQIQQQTQPQQPQQQPQFFGQNAQNPENPSGIIPF